MWLVVISTVVPELKDFSMSQAVTYTVKVMVTSQKCCKELNVDTCYCRLLIESDTWTSNRAISNDLDQLAIANQFKCNFSNNCAALDRITTDIAMASRDPMQFLLSFSSTFA